jgi:hypothetical protein
MGSREDDEYWDTKYAEATCYVHGEDEMYYSHSEGEWYCLHCQKDDENLEAYNNG